jgi:hypothetical protein
MCCATSGRCDVDVATLFTSDQYRFIGQTEHGPTKEPTNKLTNLKLKGTYNKTESCRSYTIRRNARNVKESTKEIVIKMDIKHTTTLPLPLPYLVLVTCLLALVCIDEG